MQKKKKSHMREGSPSSSLSLADYNVSRIMLTNHLANQPEWDKLVELVRLIIEQTTPSCLNCSDLEMK